MFSVAHGTARCDAMGFEGGWREGCDGIPGTMHEGFEFGGRDRSEFGHGGGDGDFGDGIEWSVGRGDGVWREEQVQLDGDSGDVFLEQCRSKNCFFGCGSCRPLSKGYMPDPGMHPWERDYDSYAAPRRTGYLSTSYYDPLLLEEADDFTSPKHPGRYSRYRPSSSSSKLTTVSPRHLPGPHQQYSPSTPAVPRPPPPPPPALQLTPATAVSPSHSTPQAQLPLPLVSPETTPPPRQANSRISRSRFFSRPSCAGAGRRRARVVMGMKPWPVDVDVEVR